MRREAREKAAREREEEDKIKREKDEEERKARKEGGLWIETSSGKKGKTRKNGSTGISGLTTPLNPRPVTRPVVGPHKKKENGSGEPTSPKKQRGVDPGGRAGFWGPKKILTKKENIASINNSNGSDGPDGDAKM